jgi:hypothetical protein
MPPRLGQHHAGTKEGMEGRKEFFYPYGKTYAQTLGEQD